MKKFLLGCTALVFAAAPAFGQMADMQQTEATQVAQKIEVNQDGSLTGTVYANVAGEETPVDAKITLVSEGVVVEAVQTENGSFSFANIAPGSYTITGATPGFAGGQAYEVAPYNGTGHAPFNLGLQSTNNVVYQNPTAFYNAPVSSVSSTVGGGGGISGGGIGRGRLFGGRLGGRRLLRAGLIGGVVAIAVSDDDDDVSADQ